MPVIKVKTVESKVGWTNPTNEEHKSYDLVLEVDGRRVEARTFSDAVAREGYEGEVQTYEKQNHTYVKPVRQDGGYSSYGKAGSGFSPRRNDNTDRSDGQRQGMCVNNAANLVNASFDLKDGAEKWASLVHEFASALYAKGDLKKMDTNTSDIETVNEPLDLGDVKEIFGGK